MSVYAINRKSVSGPPWVLHKITGILIEAENIEAATEMLGGHVDDKNDIFFKRSELEKNPAWREVEYASTDIADIVFAPEKVIAFALEIEPGLDLNVAFFGDQESHLDDHPWEAISSHMEMKFSEPGGSDSEHSVQYYFRLENVGVLYRQET